MAILSFEQFAEMLDQVVSRIPPRYLRGLNGGFNLQKDKKRQGRYFIMGEYIESGILGCIIMFYYGSFVELLKDKPIEVWEAEIIDTVLHELQHHLESMAGRDDLARELQGE
jgi:hypothetical protein